MSASSELTPILIKLWLHITNRRKKQISGIVVLMLMTSVAEVVSIGAVVPFFGSAS